MEEARLAEARRLMANLRGAHDVVDELAGRGHVLIPGEPVIPSGPPITEQWLVDWDRATAAEREAERAWRDFMQDPKWWRG